MAMRPHVSLDAVRAGLGCLLVFLQAHHAHSLQEDSRAGSLFTSDWGFLTAVACHAAWLLSCFVDSWHAGIYCSAAWLVPRLSMFVQLTCQRDVPPTAARFTKSCRGSQRAYWLSLVEACVYASGEFPPGIFASAVTLEAASMIALWASVYAVARTTPDLSAVAQAILRMLLILCLTYWHRLASVDWLRRLQVLVWPNRSVQAIKTDATYGLALAQTPVHSSLLCCSNPALLSTIAASSAKDLQPVRLERLSPSPNLDELLLAPPPLVKSHLTTATQAYDLARKLVSSAGSGAAAGVSDSTAHTSSYSSAARKVRVSVKIPDRAPDDVPPGLDTELRINGQRESALVLFTYMRRGCIQLVLDFLNCVPAGLEASRRGAGSGTDCLPPSPSTLRPSNPKSLRQHEPSCPAGQSPCSPEIALPTEPQKPLPMACSSRGGIRSGQPAGRGAAADVAGPLTPHDVRDPLLKWIGSQGLMAGRIVTLQVGSAVSLVRVPADTTAGAGAEGTLDSGTTVGNSTLGASQRLADGTEDLVVAPPLPPDVHVWPQVICTARCRGWRWGRQGRRLSTGQPPPVVQVTASWGRHDASGRTGGSPGPVLQLTARQQGQFLPVFASAVPPKHHLRHGSGGCVSPASLRAALPQAAVAVAVEHLHPTTSRANSPSSLGANSHGNSIPAGATAPPRNAGRHGEDAATYQLAFCPAQPDGLVKLELSRGGVHSVNPASVLLVSSPAVAYELQQLLAAASLKAGGCSDAAANGSTGCLLEDFGTLMDLVAALAQECGADQAAELHKHLLYEWVFPTGVDVDTALVPVSVILLNAHSSPHPRCRAAHTHSDVESDSGEEGSEEMAEYRRQRLLALAAVGCRLGFNLLRFFLSSGMPSCAVGVLDVLHGQLGLPAAHVARYMCPEGLTLLHHAAHSGSFATIAAFAGWLEAHGVTPIWTATCAMGLTPLHLAAVVPGGDTAAALLQVRWWSAWQGWRRGGEKDAAGCCCPSPAELAQQARGASSERGPGIHWQRAADIAMAMGVGGAWRSGAALWRRWVPERMRRTVCNAVAPSLCFSLPQLETSYVEWTERRTLLADHVSLGLYIAYSLLGAYKQGWLIVPELANILILLVRLCILGLHLPVFRLREVRSRRSHAQQPLAKQHQQGQQPTEAMVTAPLKCPKEGGGGARPCRVWLPPTREGRALLVEGARSALMTGVAAGWVPLAVPNGWRLLVNLRLDFVFNIIMRPVVGQIRVLASALSSAISMVGECAVLVLIMREKQQRYLLVAVVARSMTTHFLGLVFTMLLQGPARGRFLTLIHNRQEGVKRFSDGY